MPSENLNSETILPELYFLVAHFFNDSRFKEYIQPLIRQLELHQVLPPRIDWQGNKHPRSFDELIRHNQHISPNHLLKLLNQLRIVTDSLCENRLGSIDSLLGQGQYSLIQDIERLNNVRKGVQSKWTNVEAIPKDLYCKYTPLPPNAAAAVTQANSPFGTTNLILNLSRRELGANMPSNHIVQPEYFRTVNLHKRILGHLSCVYCVCFDRTGRYILTGADDNLIKAWSSSDGRLLATFRGHDKEISDIDLNYENTLMASGSCDKMIRIWNLRTTESTTVLQGHTSAVSNVEFSPYCKGNTRWLASSGNDGLICFWQWSSQTLHFNPKPKKFIEKSRPGSQMLCLSFSAGGFFMAAGSNDHAIRVYYMDDDEPKKLHELECHSNWVDSILYANRSAHFLSGSKDGTAVIWRLDENNRWKGDLIDGSKTLQRSEPDEFSHLDIHKRYPVTMVAWNCDDTLVITSQTNLVIKVWSTNPIDLVHELRGHTDEIYVLEAHPRDPRILLSASHDGHLMLWNLLTGKLIRKFYNRVDNEGHACFFDTKWSPTLDLFASTDSHGSLSIFGLGSDEPYKKCPSEQFFHTDYRPLMGDAHSFVVDEQTQQPPHLMPPPFLVNSEGNPYESDLQRLVPGREHLTHAQLIPHVVTHENGLSEIIGDRAAEDDDDDDVAVANRPSTSGALNHNNANPRPSNAAAAAAAANSANRLLWLKDFIRPLDIELLRTSEMNRLERLEHEESQHLQGIRSMMERNKQTHQVYVFRELESPLKNTDSRRRRGMPSSGLYSTRRRDLDVYEDETNQSLQPPALHHDENTEDHYVNVDGEEDSNTQFSATNGPTTSAAASASATTSHRLTSFTNAIQSIRARNGEPYSRNTMTSRAAAAQPAQSDLASSNESASESYSDWSEEDGHRRVTKNPRRSQTARPTIVKTRSGRISTRRIVKRPEEDEDMDTAGLDTTATADEPSIIGKRKPGRPSRKTKKVLMSDDDEPTTSAAATATATSSRSLRKTATTAGEESDEEDESSNENSSDDEDEDDDMDMDEEFDKPCTSNQANKSSSGGKKKKRPGRKSKSRNKTTDNVNLNDAIAQECPKEYRPPEWLTSTKARKSPYVPQIGDEVVYFRQGHELYLEAVQNQNAYELKDEDTLPSVDVADVQEFCRVLDVHVEIRPPRLVCLKLSTQSNKRFKVRYHDMPNVVDFVILRQTYERGIERHWKPKERFKSLIDDLWYIGCVEAKLPFQDEHPECEFQSLRIVWDTGEEEAMSPWDLEPLSGVNSRKVKPVMAAASSGVGGAEPTPVTPEELKSLLYVPDSDEWPEHGRDQECERILTGLETIMQLSIAEHFNYPVDLDAYPRYAMTIGYPIDLNTIKERLENRYYRRLSALQWDVRLIQTNANRFNLAKSEIVQRATLLTSLLLEFIDDQYCTNPMPIYKRMCQSSGGGTPSTNNKRTAVTNGVKTRHQEAAESQQKSSTTKSSTSAATSNLQFKLRPRDTRGAIGGRHSTRQHRDDDAHKTTAEVVAKWWHSEARQLVEDISDHPDADPFLEPVDTKKYSDYLHFVETPMDFGLVRGFLAAGKYKELRDFDNDCRLVFRNSKAYTTDRNSQIYMMTRRLERYYNNRISEIFRNQESTLSELPRHSKLRSTKYTGGGNMYVSSSRDRPARDDYHQRETRGGRPTRQTSKYFDPDLYDDHSNAATTSTTKQPRSSRHYPSRRHKVVEDDDDEEEDDDESQQNDDEVDEEPTTSRRRRDETSAKKEPETTARVEESAEQDEDNAEYDLNEAYLSTSNVDTSAVAAKKELDTSTETSEAVAPVREEKESQERRHSGLDDDSDEEKEETKQRKRAGKVDYEDEYEAGQSDEKGSDEDEDDEEGSNEEASDFESSNDDDDDDDDDDEDFGKSSKKKRKKNNVDKKKSKSKRGRKKGSSKQSSKGLSHSNNSRGASSSKTATKTSSTTKSSIMTRHHHSSTRSADNKENDETTVSRGMSSRGKESAAAASSSGSSSMMLSARSSSRRAKRTHCYREYTSDEAEDNVDEDDDDDDNELTIDSIDDASRRTRRSGLVNGTSSSASKRARIVHDEEANHAYGLDHLESNNPMRISSRTRVRTSR